MKVYKPPLLLVEEVRPVPAKDKWDDWARGDPVKLAAAEVLRRIEGTEVERIASGLLVLDHTLWVFRRYEESDYVNSSITKFTLKAFTEALTRSGAEGLNVDINMFNDRQILKEASKHLPDPYLILETIKDIEREVSKEENVELRKKDLKRLREAKRAVKELAEFVKTIER